MHHKLIEDLELIENKDLAVRVTSTQLGAEDRNKKYWLTDMEYTSETFILRGTPSEIKNARVRRDVVIVEELIDFLHLHSYDYPKARNVKLELDGVPNDDYYGICDAFSVPTVEVNDDVIVIYGWVADKKANAVWDRHAKMYKPYSWLSKDRLINLLERGQLTK